MAIVMLVLSNAIDSRIWISPWRYSLISPFLDELGYSQKDIYNHSNIELLFLTKLEAVYLFYLV